MSTDLLSGGVIHDGGALGGGAHDHVSQSTRLHHKMREMKEMDDALALMQSEYSERIRAVKDGEAKFLVKQHNIIKYLRRFKLFILESDTKRARAEKKESEEHRQRNLKVREIEQLRAQFLQLQQTRSDLKQKNDHYKQNKQFLESVKDAVPEQYGEIDELIVRHQILKQTNTDLTEANRVVTEKMEAINTELQTLYKTKQNDILVKNSKFASLLQKLETVTNETSSIENEVVAVEQRTRDMNRYFCEVQMAIQNIYARTMSSLPSAKAATQMKKRMQQQAVASKEAAAAAAANGTAPLEDLSPGPSSMPTSRLGSAGSFIDDMSDLSDDEDGAGTTAAAQSSPADEAATRAALAASSRTMALKQQSVKQHLVSRLEAIMERLEDLQDIVDYIQPGALQVLREGGSIYAANAAAHTLAATSAGAIAGANTDRARGGGAGGRRSGTTGYVGTGGRAYVSGSSNNDPSADSFRRSRAPNAPPPPAAMQHSSSKRVIAGSRRGGGVSSSHSDFDQGDVEKDGTDVERKFRAINLALTHTVPGLFDEKTIEIPAHQMAVARGPLGKSLLPPVKPNAAPSKGPSPRSPRRR